MLKTISKSGQKLLDYFLQLPFTHHPVPCPYVNNRREFLRGSLRVLIGKGTPQEIVEEAQLIAWRNRVNLANLQDSEIEEFLTKHNLGIDCSGLAYWILDAELKIKKNISLKSVIKFPLVKNPWRRLLCRLRPSENAGTKTLGHPKNSLEVPLSQIKPGDFLVMFDGTDVGNPNHLIIFYAIEYKKENPQTLFYAEAILDKNHGLNGVRTQSIKIVDYTQNLTNQIWEKEKNEIENLTLARAKKSRLVRLCRLWALKD